MARFPGFTLVSFAAEGDPPTPAQEKTLQVADGVTYTYRHYEKARFSAHTLIVDLSRNDLSVAVAKALDHIAGLERTQSILQRIDSARTFTSILGGVNANFWAAGSHHPIGPTVIDGELLNNRRYKNWSSLAIGEDKSMHIDNFDVNTKVVTRHGAFPVSRMNERRDSLSTVIYNSWYGSTVPYFDTTWINLASADTLTDDSEGTNGAAAASEPTPLDSKESGALKAQFEYLVLPRVNGMVQCRITHVDTGFVSVPRNGGVVSFGHGLFPFFFSLFIGDTFSIVTELEPKIEGQVLQMTSGSPRLLRNGRISIEWQEEGLRKPRFVTNGYGRTGVGISKDGQRLILVTIEPPNRRQRRKGGSLHELASVLRDRGAYNAFNLDGGSSATMVVGDATVSPPGGARVSRKISTALMILQATAEK